MKSFPLYDVTNVPEIDFLKAVENIFVQPYVKEWDFKAIKHIYGQGPVYIRTWYCLNLKLDSEVGRDPFSSSDDDMDSEDYETESYKCTGNFSHLKDLISTHVNNISTSPSEVETEDQPRTSSRSNLWFEKRLELMILNHTLQIVHQNLIAKI